MKFQESYEFLSWAHVVNVVSQNTKKHNIVKWDNTNNISQPHMLENSNTSLLKRPVTIDLTQFGTVKLVSIDLDNADPQCAWTNFLAQPKVVGFK